MSQHCTKCSNPITDRELAIYAKAHAKGIHDWDGLCLPHIKDDLARRKLEKIAANKAAANAIGRIRRLPNGQGYAYGEVSKNKAAALLDLPVATLNLLILTEIVNVRETEEGIPAVEVDSIKRLVQIIEDDQTELLRKKGIPEHILDKLYDRIPDIIANLQEYDEQSVQGAPD